MPHRIKVQCAPDKEDRQLLLYVNFPFPESHGERLFPGTSLYANSYFRVPPGKKNVSFK